MINFEPDAMNEQPVTIRFDTVGYTVGDTVILADLNLDVYEGEILVLLGESGCGKTKTLKLINRLIKPTSGEILVE
jgi:osmoprotectant transport system ATP-binding protein